MIVPRGERKQQQQKSLNEQVKVMSNLSHKISVFAMCLFFTILVHTIKLPLLYVNLFAWGLFWVSGTCLLSPCPSVEEFMHPGRRYRGINGDGKEEKEKINATYK